MKNLALLFLVILPIVNLVIIIGHVFFVKLFGGKIRNIKIGMGSTVIEIDKFAIRSFFFYGYEYNFFDLKVKNILAPILIHLGGIIFAATSAVILYVLFLKGSVPGIYLTYNLILAFIVTCIYELLPITLAGADTSCKQVLQLIMKQKYEKMLKDEKNHEIVLEKLSKEVTRLKELSEKPGPDYMEKKYISAVINKSFIEAEIGRFGDAIKTLKSIHIEISEDDDRYKILYYNNLLSYCLKAGLSEEINELYSNLTELLSKKENKAYHHEAYDDTIENYKRYVINNKTSI